MSTPTTKPTLDAPKKKPELKRTKSAPLPPIEQDEPTDPISEEDDPFEELQLYFDQHMESLSEKMAQQQALTYKKLKTKLAENHQSLLIQLQNLAPPPEAAVSPPPHQNAPWKTFYPQNKRSYPYYQQPYSNKPFKQPRFGDQ